MGHIIEITESKYDHLVENAEKMLRYGGKVMQCLDELCEEEHYGERGGRGGYGMRGEERGIERGGRYGRGMGMREHEREDDWDDYDRDPYMGERRRRSSRTGRYIRG